VNSPNKVKELIQLALS